MIDKKIVEYIAQLARVKIDEEEKEFLGVQLSKILGYIDKLKELNVENITPTRGAFFENNVVREDTVVDSQRREYILKNAPETSDRYFKIPKVIE